MDEQAVDVVVLGGGPAGENVAGGCAAAGLSVVLVERELVGGECSYWGCVPSKTLIRPGDVVFAAGRVPGAAEAVTGPVDVAAALAQRDYMTSGWSDAGQARWLADAGARLVRGHGRLAGDRTVEVEAEDGPVRLRAARAVVLATGTSAALPPIPGLDGVGAWDNRDATAVKELPRRLLVLGGGAVGAELAQAFRRLGSAEVTLVEGRSRLLAREEPFAGEQVRAALEGEGVTVLLESLLAAVRRDGSDGPVVGTLRDGREVVADEILVAVGRRPATGDLGLQTVGLEPGRFVDVDGQLRATGVPGGWLYAVGDCNGQALLTHMGKYQARVATDVILGRDTADRASTRVVPRVTFTDPQVCAVGPTEAEARAAGVPVRVVSTATGGVAGAYTQGNGIAGTSQLVVDDARGLVVGATFTGPGVQELLHSATVAIAGQVPMSVLEHAVPSFPTISEVWLRLVEAYRAETSAL
jgi:pyruvate/2-oxoglutarate dehydrogenase complex dihydrolipoamide dehydrogenase (E3) component